MVLQSFEGYLGLALVFLWNGALRHRCNFCFQEFFASIGILFILVGGGELGAGLSFYGVLRFS